MKSKNLWIVNAWLITQDKKRRQFNANIHIRSGQIIEITQKQPKKRQNTRILDAKGKYLLPGFVQTHVHLCQTLFRNQADDLELLDWLKKRIWLYESAHDKSTMYLSALLGISELLSTGTTCILDMASVRHTSSVLEAVKHTGIRANVGKCLMDDANQNPSSLCEKTEAALNEACLLFEKWNGKENDRIRVSFAPRFALSCTKNLLKEVGRIAPHYKALIHTHANENKKEVALVHKLTGKQNIEYLDLVGLLSPKSVIAHGIWLTEKEKKLLANSKTSIAHCPSSNLKLASGIASVVELRNKGINVGIGVDGAPCNNSLNIFQEMRLAALLQKPFHGPTTLLAQEVLDMATRDGAKALDWFSSIGSIEKGKRADLVCLDLNQPHLFPLSTNIVNTIVYAANGSEVDWTMVDGHIVYKRGHQKTKDLLQKTKKAWTSIAKKTGVIV